MTEMAKGSRRRSAVVVKEEFWLFFERDIAMPSKPTSTARLEAFSDGVIAVIITITVLELKVPHENGIQGLYAILPTSLVYLLSFSFTGIYWINHRDLIERIEFSDHLTLYANLGFLFCLSLLPFSTSYVLDKKIDSFAVCLYGVSMVVTGFSFLLLRLAIHRNLRRSRRFEAEDASMQRKHLMSPGLYLLSVPIAFFHPYLALSTIALVTVIWILPNLAVKKRSGVSQSHNLK